MAKKKTKKETTFEVGNEVEVEVSVASLEITVYKDEEPITIIASGELDVEDWQGLNEEEQKKVMDALEKIPLLSEKTIYLDEIEDSSSE